MHKPVVLAACNHNANYAFYLPMLARSWSAVGFAPLCFLVGDYVSWSEEKWAMPLREANKCGLTYEFIACPPTQRPSTVAQCSRLFGGLTYYAQHNLADDDYIMAGDIDALALPRMTEMREGIDATKDITMFFTNAYEHEPKLHYTIQNFTARTRWWRERALDYGYTPSDAVAAFLQARLGDRTHTLAADWDEEAWYTDEFALTDWCAALPGWQNFSNDQHSCKRMRPLRALGCAENRMDRVDYDAGRPLADPSTCLDFHAMRPRVWDDKPFAVLHDAWRRAWGTTESDWLAQYRGEFVRLHG